MLQYRSPIFLIAAAIAIFSSVSVNGQKDSYTPSVKVYSVFSWFAKTSGGVISLEETNRSMEFGRIVPAFEFRNAAGHFHEVGLTRLMLKHTFELTEDTTVSYYPGSFIEKETRDQFNIAVSYGYHLNLAKNWKRIHPYIGASVMPSIYTEITRPMLTTNEYRHKVFSTSLYFQLVPRLIINMSEQVYLDMNIPFSPGNLYYSRVKTDNPNLPIEERTTSSIGFYSDQIFKQLVCQIGFGIKLGGI